MSSEKKPFVNSKGFPIAYTNSLIACGKCPCDPCAGYPAPILVLPFRSKFHEFLYYTWLPGNEELKNVRKCKIDIDGYDTFDLFLYDTGSRPLEEWLYDSNALNSPYDGRYYYKEGTPYPHPPPMTEYWVEKRKEEHFAETGEELNLVEGEDYIDFNHWVQNYFSFYDLLKNGEDYRTYKYGNGYKTEGADVTLGYSKFHNIPYNEAKETGSVYVVLELKVTGICMTRTIGISGLNPDAENPCNSQALEDYRFEYFVQVIDFTEESKTVTSYAGRHLWLDGDKFFNKKISRIKGTDKYALSDSSENEITEMCGISFEQMQLYPEVVPFNYSGEIHKKYTKKEIENRDIQDEDWINWYSHFGESSDCRPWYISYEWGVDDGLRNDFSFRAYAFADNEKAEYGQYYYPPITTEK